MSIDAATVIALLLAAALGGALIALLPEWRRLMSGRLPIHQHLRPRAQRPPFEAELRCALCAGRPECAKRAAPLDDCPNAALFRTGASKRTSAPTA